MTIANILQCHLHFFNVTMNTLGVVQLLFVPICMMQISAWAQMENAFNSTEIVTTTTWENIAGKNFDLIKEPLSVLSNLKTDSTPTRSAYNDGSVLKANGPCETVGNLTHEHDCHLYYSCTQAVDGLNHTSVLQCPVGQAFNIERARCMYDLSPCSDDFQCQASGNFADAQSNFSYNWCIPRLSGDGFHRYRVRCATGQVYAPKLEMCFLDINNMEDFPLNYDQNIEKSMDVRVIKAELKEFRAAEKMLLKKEKIKEKMIKKLEKEMLKSSLKVTEKNELKNI